MRLAFEIQSFECELWLDLLCWNCSLPGCDCDSGYEQETAYPRAMEAAFSYPYDTSNSKTVALFEVQHVHQSSSSCSDSALPPSHLALPRHSGSLSTQQISVRAS